MITLSAADWMTACTDPAARLIVERFGRSRVGRGWRLRERRVPEHYCFLLLDRSGRAEAAGRQLHLRRDSCVWIAPELTHSLAPDDPDHPFRFFHWRFRLLRDGRELRMQPDAVLRAHAGHLRPLFESAWAEWQSALPLRGPRLRALLAAITADLLRGPEPGAGGLLTERERRTLLEHIHARLPAPIHPAELAAVLGRSHDYATRLIRSSFSLPPRQLILRERIRAAAEDLAGNTAIGRVALRWGFGDQRYFARQFRRVMGCTPSTFRARNRDQGVTAR